MAHAPFSLQDSLIAYGDDKRAGRIVQPLAELRDPAVNCIMGIVALVDGDSVHADHWECHPGGDEILYVLEGRLVATIVGEESLETTVTLEKGQALIVPQASWHRLRVLEPGRLLFFTPGAGTELRPYAKEAAAEAADRVS